MLSLTRKTDYALIALCHLAHEPGRVCTAREISERYHLPAALLMNVLKLLSHSDLVSSTRGAKGGYQLGIAAAEISLANIIEAVEGPVQFVQCSGHDGESAGGCEIVETCPIRGPVGAIQKRLEEFLSGITLKEIAVNANMTCVSDVVPVNVMAKTQVG